MLKYHFHYCNIGPTDYREASASLMYVLDFLYNYLLHGQCVEEAHRIASYHPDDRKQFHLYKAQAHSA